MECSVGHVKELESRGRLWEMVVVYLKPGLESVGSWSKTRGRTNWEGISSFSQCDHVSNNLAPNNIL